MGSESKTRSWELKECSAESYARPMETVVLDSMSEESSELVATRRTVCRYIEETKFASKLSR